MREEEVPKGLKNDIRVWLLIAAVVLSVVMIGPGYSAEEGLNTDLNYGLDLEGGSWIQIKLQGAVTQLDADISMLVTEIVESAGCRYSTGCRHLNAGDRNSGVCD